MSKFTATDLTGWMRRLATLKGESRAAEWVIAFKDDIARELAKAPKPDAVVDAAMKLGRRPTPQMIAEIVTQQRATEQEAGEAPKGCPDCGYSGWRTGRTLRRTAGKVHGQEAAFGCGCARGRGYVEKSRAVDVGAFIVQMQGRTCVPRMGDMDGLLGWGVTDRRWTAWSPSLYADEEEMAESRRAAQERLADRDARALAGKPQAGLFGEKGDDALGAW